MRGETHTSLAVTERGVRGDRVWAVRDEVRGGIRGAKKIPSLMTLSANFTGAVNERGASPTVITAPDGSAHETDSADINDWLSEKLNHLVTLSTLLDDHPRFRRFAQRPGHHACSGGGK